MSFPTPGRYHLRYAGKRLEVETARRRLATTARLFVDGEPVDDQTTSFGAARLKADGVDVAVHWGLFGQVTKCGVVPEAEGEKKDEETEIPFEPPAGSFAAKREKLARDHPSLYASRHVVIAVFEVLIGLLGIGAILFGLLPRLDLPSIPWSDIEFSVPEWIRTVLSWPDAIIAVPVGWVRAFVDWLDLSLSVPDWFRTLVQSAKWWIPILIAVFVAVEEVKRRRRASSTEPGEDSGQSRDATE